MTAKGIASLVAKMVPKEKMLNADSVWQWRLEMAAELGALSILTRHYKEFRQLGNKKYVGY